MKILMTGMTSRQCGSDRLRYDYLTFPPILKAGLERLGHQVDHKKVGPGDDLAPYDLAFVGICPIGKLQCSSVMSAVHAAKGISKVILYVDDWTVVEIGHDWRYNLYKRWAKWTAWKGLSKEDASEAELFIRLVTGPGASAYPLLAPLFPWGRHEKLLEGNLSTPLLWLDPSPYVQVPEFVEPIAKNTAWVSATLQDHDKWISGLSLKWPVIHLGNKRKDQPVVSEPEVVTAYARNWGVLCPKYDKAGSGWWRARFNYAMATKSIILCDHSEGAPIGKAFELSKWGVETKQDSELREIAERQAETFHSQTWTKGEFDQRLKEILG